MERRVEFSSCLFLIKHHAAGIVITSLHLAQAAVAKFHNHGGVCRRMGRYLRVIWGRIATGSVKNHRVIIGKI